VEGETDDSEVLSLRHRMQRNACAVLMCSRGTPMFLAGDEFGNTKFGNNNSYCQDNEISWVDWSLFEKNQDLFEFFKFMIEYRKKHPIIRKRLPEAVCGMEPLQTHDINADNHQIPDGARTIGVSMAGYDREKGKDDIIYVAINTYWEDVEITLPKLQNGAWRLSVDTYGDKKGRYFYKEGKEPRMGSAYRMKPRTVAVFTKRDF
jgi:glycogen operon protein